MPLITCPECGKQISDQAQSCPSCGKPMKPILIEQTRKKWKVAQLISGLILAVGMILLFRGILEGFNNWKSSLGILTIFLGFIGLFIGNLGAWWNNR